MIVWVFMLSICTKVIINYVMLKYRMVSWIQITFNSLAFRSVASLIKIASGFIMRHCMDSIARAHLIILFVL